MEVDEAGSRVFALYLHDVDASIYTIIECSTADCTLVKAMAFETWSNTLRVFGSSFSASEGKIRLVGSVDAYRDLADLSTVTFSPAAMLTT